MGNEQANRAAAKRLEPGLRTYFALMLGSICWGVFWPPANSLLAVPLGFFVLVSIGGFFLRLSRRYKVVPRDEHDDDRPTR